jgi:hypothetical protein
VSGTINYSTGAVAITVTGSAATDIITATYQFDTEQGDASNLRELEIGLRIIPVVAKEHPLRLSWSVPAQFAASAAVGLDVEDTLSILAGQFIKIERDRQLINLISTTAGPARPELEFDARQNTVSLSTGYSRTEHFNDFGIKISIAENLIFGAAGRGSVSWIVAGLNACTVLSSMRDFVREPVVVPIGAHVIGSINGVSVIKDPGSPPNQFIMGYNGVLPGDTSVVLAESKKVKANSSKFYLSSQVGNA